jgi:alcohol dehydrogenase class IV
MNFTFSHTPNIIFGAGSINEIPKLIHVIGHEVLLVTGSGSFMNSEKGKEILNLLYRDDFSINIASVDTEPSPADIDTIVNEYRDSDIDVVIGLGGGSVIDAAKAVSAMLPMEGAVKDYLEGVGTRAHPGKKLPLLAVPTTSGTGSEATKNAVLSEVGGKGYKKSLRHDNFVPDYAIVDPGLVLSCPPQVTAASGMDAFCQLLESYLSTKGNPLTDSLAYGAMRYIKSSLLPAYQTGKVNLEARTGMAYASLVSGITLAHAGLGVVHGFASAIGGYFNIPHGVVCGTLMGVANETTVQKLKDISPEHPALKKYATVGKLFSDKIQIKQDYYVYLLMEVIDDYIGNLRIPRLGEYGVTEADMDKIIAKTGNKNNPVELEKEELRSILKARL